MNLFSLVFFIFLSFPKIVLADDALVCLKEIAKHEKNHKIQTNLLGAIALVESGRYTKKYPTGIAWPWTVTAEGNGKFFDTKKQALDEVVRLKTEGITNIDVGCMQINLRYHPNAFKSLEDALDPDKNVAYAALFLKKNYQDTKSWGMAATQYHSKTTHKAYRYEDKLLEAFKKLVKYGNPAKPDLKAVEKKLPEKMKPSPRQSSTITKKQTEKIKAAPVEKAKLSKELAAQWRKEKLEAYMAQKKKEQKEITP